MKAKPLLLAVPIALALFGGVALVLSGGVSFGPPEDADLLEKLSFWIKLLSGLLLLFLAVPYAVVVALRRESAGPRGSASGFAGRRRAPDEPPPPPRH